MIDAALLLPKILDAAGEKPEMTEAAVRIAWSRAAGAGLRRHAIPFRLYGKTLIVSVADAIWQKQLLPMGPELIFRINKLLRRQLIDSLEFRVDPAAFRGQKSATSTSNRRPKDQPLPESLISAAVEIADAELRQRFLRAAENCIARRELLNRS